MPKAARAHDSPRVQVTLSAQASIARGHPWVWRDALHRAPPPMAAGTAVVVEGPGGALGQGLWDPESPIAVRMYLATAEPSLDDSVLAEQVTRAIARRSLFIDPSRTSAYRLCHGEGDRVPGLVLDRYGPVVVARVEGAAMQARFDEVARRIWGALRSMGVRTLALRRAPRHGQERGADRAPDRTISALEPVLGDPPPDEIVVLENGMSVHVDLARGQKTGAFLDQRDNRARVRELAQGRSVLNLFSYAGGFSVAAALGGARSVTSVDVAQAAHAAAQRSMRDNGLDPSLHEFITADVFAFLGSMALGVRRWDLVISDPPSFAPNERSVQRALSAYRKLHRACVGVLAPEGVFCAASCSSHIQADAFLGTLDDAALGRSDLRLLGLFGPPADHPTLAAWPEGRYLKFAVLA